MKTLIPGNLYEVAKRKREEFTPIEFLEENFLDKPLDEILRTKLKKGKVVMFLEEKSFTTKAFKRRRPVFLVNNERMIINSGLVRNNFFSYFKDVTP